MSHWFHDRSLPRHARMFAAAGAASPPPPPAPPGPRHDGPANPQPKFFGVALTPAQVAALPPEELERIKSEHEARVAELEARKHSAADYDAYRAAHEQLLSELGIQQ
jgi:hypothetical protein